MKKFGKALVTLFGVLFLFCVGALAACGDEEEPPQAKTYTLTLDFDGTQGDVTATKPASGEKYAENESVTITVSAKESFETDTVTVNGTAVSLTEGKYTFSITSDTTVKATFKPTAETVLYSVQLEDYAAEHGTVLVSEPAAGGLYYEKGETVTVTAVPAEHYAVGSVLVNGAPIQPDGEGNYVFSVEDNTVISVTFDALPITGEFTFPEMMRGTWKTLESPDTAGFYTFVIGEHSVLLTDENGTRQEIGVEIESSSDEFGEYFKAIITWNEETYELETRVSDALLALVQYDEDDWTVLSLMIFAPDPLPEVKIDSALYGVWTSSAGELTIGADGIVWGGRKVSVFIDLTDGEQEPDAFWYDYYLIADGAVYNLMYYGTEESYTFALFNENDYDDQIWFLRKTEDGRTPAKIPDEFVGSWTSLSGADGVTVTSSKVTFYGTEYDVYDDGVGGYEITLLFDGKTAVPYTMRLSGDGLVLLFLSGDSSYSSLAFGKTNDEGEIELPDLAIPESSMLYATMWYDPQSGNEGSALSFMPGNITFNSYTLRILTYSEEDGGELHLTLLAESFLGDLQWGELYYHPATADSGESVSIYLISGGEYSLVPYGAIDGLSFTFGSKFLGYWENSINFDSVTVAVNGVIWSTAGTITAATAAVANASEGTYTLTFGGKQYTLGWYGEYEVSGVVLCLSPVNPEEGGADAYFYHTDYELTISDCYNGTWYSETSADVLTVENDRVVFNGENAAAVIDAGYVEQLGTQNGYPADVKEHCYFFLTWAGEIHFLYWYPGDQFDPTVRVIVDSTYFIDNLTISSEYVGEYTSVDGSGIKLVVTGNKITIDGAEVAFHYGSTGYAFTWNEKEYYLIHDTTSDYIVYLAERTEFDYDMSSAIYFLKDGAPTAKPTMAALMGTWTADGMEDLAISDSGVTYGGKAVIVLTADERPTQDMAFYKIIIAGKAGAIDYYGGGVSLTLTIGMNMITYSKPNAGGDKQNGFFTAAQQGVYTFAAYGMTIKVDADSILITESGYTDTITKENITKNEDGTFTFIYHQYGDGDLELTVTITFSDGKLSTHEQYWSWDYDFEKIS